MTNSANIPKRSTWWTTAAAAAMLTTACSYSSDEQGPAPGDDSYRVTGTIVDLETGRAIDGTAAVSVGELDPAPSVSSSGSSFVIDRVPANSAFHALASSEPTYRATYNAAIEVGDQDVDDVELVVASEGFVQTLTTALNPNASANAGIVIARALDVNGQPLAGLPATAVALPAGASGPYFLDAELQPDAGLEATSASGYVVFFDVAPGLVSLAPVVNADVAVAMPASRVDARTVTYARLEVLPGTDLPPANLSFAEDIAPIFIMRGCDACHDGGGPGKDLSDLHLNGAARKMYREVAGEMSPLYNRPRVDVANPEASLILTLPSFEDPPDRHPFATFAGPHDPDYRLILTWIAQGALDN